MGPAACAALPAFGAGLFGLLIGSLLFGPLADAIGRKRVLLVAVLVFGGCTTASAYTQSIESLTLLRFITGIGLGRDTDLHYSQLGYSPARRRMLMVTLSWSGFTAGLAPGGLLAGQIIPAFGWRGVLLVGGIAPLALLPLLARQMPESVRFMAANAKHADGYAGWSSVSPAGVGRGSPSSMTSARHRPSRRSRTCLSKGAPCALLLWAAFLCSLFVFYLLTSWLPTILKDAGYDIAHASRIGAMVPLGGTSGAILMALLMDRVGPYRVLAVSYGRRAGDRRDRLPDGRRLYAGRRCVSSSVRRHPLPDRSPRDRRQLGHGQRPFRFDRRLDARRPDDDRCRIGGSVLPLAGAASAAGRGRHLPALSPQPAPSLAARGTGCWHLISRKKAETPSVTSRPVTSPAIG